MADEAGPDPTPVHRYRTELRWSGSTGAGYEAYERAHDLIAPPAGTGLALSSDPAFRGDPSRLNPEQLLVAAASSCQLLSFLAVAARARLDVVGYVDEATAEMPEDDPPMRIVRIELRPRIELADTDRPRPSADRLAHLAEVAHRECFIANSLRTDVTVHPTFTWR
ncbi:MAG: OsmC family protein [Acidimicrobiales bacterium]|nr:OsmC family protein [Acidimicrobiales bacterium]HRW38004.1 OsmC family protein [Aquihabitans sp.]